MAMPSLKDIKGPALQYLKDGTPRKLGEASDALASIFKLTESERTETVSSGTQLKWRNRVNWALFELWKAGLLNRPKQGTYEISATGKAVAEENPAVIDGTYLKRFPEWLEYLKAGLTKQAQTADVTPALEPSPEQEDNPPEERMASAYSELQSKLKRELLEQTKQMDPFQFERLVVDLLVAMGYGGGKRDSAQVTKMTNDEGIDGIINDDTLGLDVIYVQAKRWKGSVGRVDIQNFVGALAGQKAHKGIFITTSAFAATAVDYVRSIQQKIILIDGDRLAGLMIQHNIGVSEAAAYQIKRVDSDYFTQQ